MKFDEVGPMEAVPLTNEQADCIQRHLEEHGQDAIEMALAWEHDFLLNSYRAHRAEGLSQHEALAAARKALSEL